MSDTVRRFGAFLIELGLVTEMQVQEALALQPLTGTRVGESLLSLGYLTRGRGISVHRPECTAFRRLAERNPARVLPVEWGAGARGGHEVAVRVDAIDRRHLLKDLTNLMAQHGVNVQGMHADQVRAGQGHVRVQLRLRVADYGQLGLLLGRLEALPGVQSARRA